MPTGNANYAAMAAATTAFWASGEFKNAVYDGVPFIKWLLNGDRERTWDGGTPILEPVMFDGNNTVQAQTYYQEVNNTPQDGLTAAQFTPKMYSATVIMSRVEQALNAGENQMIDLWETKCDQAILGMQNRLGSDVFLDGTADANAVTGLAAIVSATGTYGNISRTSNTYWQAYVEATAAVLSESYIRTGYNTASRLNSYVDLMITTQTLFEVYESLIVPTMRAQMPQSVGDLGVPYLEYKGVPIIYDNNCQSGTWYFLNSKFLKWRPLQGWNMQIDGPLQPVRQAVDEINIYWVGALTANNCRYEGKLTGKTA